MQSLQNNRPHKEQKGNWKLKNQESIRYKMTTMDTQTTPNPQKIQIRLL
jgi:hypothetical protein